MNHVYLHTIALEPSRWTPDKVWRPLPELLPEIAAAGFTELEIFEPHAEKIGFENLKHTLDTFALRSPILSSYIRIGVEDEEAEIIEKLRRGVIDGKFSAVRLFPGKSRVAGDQEAVKRFTTQMAKLANALPQVDFLLETHDGSLGEESDVIVNVLKDLQNPKIGLLWQPLIFTREEARRQFALQQPWIRHYHLQNRNKDNQFVEIFSGLVPWEEFLTAHPVNASVEFVRAGLKPAADFSLADALAEARTAQEIALKILNPLS